MQRRCVDHDYTARRMYMVTMTTEGRQPLFGRVVGRSEAVEPSPEAPRMELSPLGKAVEEIWLTMGCHHHEVKVVALQMMPDHLHAVLFVREKMEKPLGKVLLGVKQACNQAFRALLWHSNTPDRAATTACSLQRASMTKFCCEKGSWSGGCTT